MRGVEYGSYRFFAGFFFCGTFTGVSPELLAFTSCCMLFLLNVLTDEIQHLWNAEIIGLDHNRIARRSHIVAINLIAPPDIAHHVLKGRESRIMFPHTLHHFSIATTSTLLQAGGKIKF